MELKPEKITCIVVHCSATKAPQDIGAKEIDEMHKAKGWAMIGYHSVIRRNGSIEGGRPLNMVGSHVFGHNTYTLGVCMGGGLDVNGKPEDNFTPEQYRALAGLITDWRATFPSIHDVCGHRDLSPDVDGDGVVEKWEWLKDCPCVDVRPWVARECP